MASEIRTLKDKDTQVLPRTRADAVSTTDGSTVQDKINNIPVISTSISSTSVTTAASSSAVKQAYDKADSADLNATLAYTMASAALSTARAIEEDYMSETGGTFTGAVYAGSSYQSYSSSLLRNSKLVSSDTTPTVNGEINWTYG